MNEKAGEYNFEEAEFPKSLDGADPFENSVTVVVSRLGVRGGPSNKYDNM